MPRALPPLLLLLLPACAGGTLVERTVVTMGTRLQVSVIACTHGVADRAAELCVREVLLAERRWSSWREDSQLRRVHAAAVGQPVSVDREFCRGLALAGHWSCRTAGAFDPGAGQLVELWGVGRGGRAVPPSPAELRSALATTGVGHFAVRATTVTRRAAAARIAEGGFAKGLALDAALGAVRVIDGLDAVVLDLGGQLAWWTAATAAPAMGRVGVAAPRRRDHAVGWIDLPAAGSLATSGNSERSITVAGAPSSHILDPRNGHPVVDWGSVTVLVTAPQDDAAMAADCLSTALYVLGPNAGLACASGLPGVQALFLEHTADGLRWHLTPGMRRVVRLAPDHSSSAACRRSRLHPPQPTTKQTPPR